MDLITASDTAITIKLTQPEAEQIKIKVYVARSSAKIAPFNLTIQ